MENNLCHQHSAIEQKLEDVSETAKMATAFFKWTVATFVIVALAVVGFLWHGQSMIADKVDGLTRQVIKLETKIDYYTDKDK